MIPIKKKALFLVPMIGMICLQEVYAAGKGQSLKPSSFNLKLIKQAPGFHYATSDEIMSYAQSVYDVAPKVDRYTTPDELAEFMDGAGVNLDPMYFAIRGPVVDDRDIGPDTRQDPVCKFTQNKLSGYTIFSIGGTLQAPLVGFEYERRRVTLLKPTREMQSKGAQSLAGGKRLDYISYRTMGEGLLTKYINGAEIERSLLLSPALLRDAAPHFECEVAMKLSYPYRAAFAGGEDPTSTKPFEIVKVGEAAVATIVQLRLFDKRTGTLIMEYPTTAKVD